MHDEACSQRVASVAVEQRLEEEARRARRLSEGARGAGAQVHTLPESPRDLADNGEFRYAVLGPEAASESGRPSASAARYLAETTGSDKPRVHRNMVVLAVPSRDGIAAARDAVRSLLGWEDVQRQLAEHTVDPLQRERLRKRLEEARRRVPDTIRAAWCVVVTLSEAGEAQAFRLPADSGPLFAQIKADERSRIKETAVDAEALVRNAVGVAAEEGLVWLRNGPTSLWNEPVPEDVLTDGAQLRARPERIPASALMDDALPSAWQDGSTNGADLTRALSRARGEAMPWGAVRESIVSSVESRWIRTKDRGAEIVRRAYRDAGRLVLERPSQDAGLGSGPDPVTQTQPATNIEGHQVQDLADLIPDLIEATAGYRLKFRVQVVLDDASDDVRTKVDQLIDSRLNSDTDPSS